MTISALNMKKTRPVVAVIVIDNYEELLKNQPDRVISELRDAVDEKLNQWCADKKRASQALQP